ncbi:MAG: hypothetical protein E6Q53_00950 [Candidatus Moraniibacteriota bacterium]|nr:MAG: hypothetical protein E6Q53_00950 [Candidatus Moranbacteria bacterium]
MQAFELIFDFLVQSSAAAIFFAILAITGRWIYRLIGGLSFERSLTLGIGYFIALPIYTLSLCGALFIFPDKRSIAVAVTLIWGFVALAILWHFRGSIRASFANLREKTHWQFFSGILIASFLMCLFLFFLQIYQTSVLDEWLHRPVVKSFLDNGVFPLVNPLSPESEYIKTYHYGTQIVSAALGLVFQTDASTALDLFKLSYVMGTLALFYGLLQRWTGSVQYAVSGTMVVFFSGSSFFLFDSFTSTHLSAFGWGLGQGWNWPINAPISYILSGITWVNIPLMIAAVFLIEERYWQQEMDIQNLIFLTLFTAGFFLVSELFAVFLLVFLGISFLRSIIRKQEKRMQAILAAMMLAIVGLAALVGMGGIVGEIIDAQWQQAKSVILGGVNEGEREVIVQQEQPEEDPPASLLALRNPSEWGYASEKRNLVIWNGPTYYARSILFEGLLLLIIIWFVYKRKYRFTEKPVFWMTVAMAWVLPFAFSTSFGNLNLSKFLTFGIVMVHLFGWVFLGLLYRTHRILAIVGIGFCIFATIPGMLMGPNIQWQIISGKGKEQYCSQNPECYKGEFTNLLRRFESEISGLKHIQTDQKNAAKIVDLTTSYVYRQIIPGVVEYLIETPEFRKTNVGEIQGRVLYESGDYRIWHVN